MEAELLVDVGTIPAGTKIFVHTAWEDTCYFEWHGCDVGVDKSVLNFCEVPLCTMQ